jgi:starvation-inducible DNA-binding protein
MTTSTDKLNGILANYQIFYQNLRGFHWLVKGRSFFSLHEKFEEMYTEVAETIDELAERVLTLGGIPLHTLEDYQKSANLKVYKNIREPEAVVGATVENLSSILTQVKIVFKEAGEKDDEATASLLSDLISREEKNIWMFKTWLDN